jgi:hypothetical protein
MEMLARRALQRATLTPTAKVRVLIMQLGILLAVVCTDSSTLFHPGLFAGVSLSGSVIVMRPDVNKNFYGVNIKPNELFTQKIHRPVAALPLYQALEVAGLADEGGTAGIAGAGNSLSGGAAPPPVVPTTMNNGAPFGTGSNSNEGLFDTRPEYSEL